MPNQLGVVRVSRRTFLRRFGVAAGALAAGQLISACSNNAAASPTRSADQGSNLLAVRSSAGEENKIRFSILKPNQMLPRDFGVKLPSAAFH